MVALLPIAEALLNSKEFRAAREDERERSTGNIKQRILTSPKCPFVLPICLLILICCLSGCHTIRSSETERHPPGLNWLTHLVPTETPVPPPLDIEQLRPVEAAAIIHPGDLLELTVWDLYEPGIPHTSPLLINSTGQSEPPLLPPVNLASLSLEESEKLLVDKYQAGEILLNPRVLVRRMETSSCSVQVLGGVERPGIIKLTHDQASIYHAIISAGGLKPNTGTRWMLTRYKTSEPPPEKKVAELPAESSAEPSVTEEKSPIEVLEEGILDESPLSKTVTTLDTSLLKTPSEERTFDITHPQDLQELKQITLQEGDILRIPEESLPVRITGIVRKPGAYSLQDSQMLSLREGLDLAGGLLFDQLPAQVTVTRPLPGGQNVERWTFPLSKHQPLNNTPPLQPGDQLHVEVSPHAQVQRVIGGLRPRHKSSTQKIADQTSSDES